MAIQLYTTLSMKQFHGFERFFEALRSECDKYRSELRFVIADQISPDEYIRRCNKKKHITIVWGLTVEQEISFITKANSAGIPYAMLQCNPIPKSIVHFNMVSVDFTEAMKELTTSLIRSGRRRIAFLGLNTNTSVDIAKSIGYKMALNENDMIFDMKNIYKYGMSGIHGAIEGVLNAKNPYDAIVCSTDSIAVLLMSEVFKRKVSVPDDLAITGFDDLIIGRFTNPKLTSVRLDFEKLGHIAGKVCRMLWEDLDISSFKFFLTHELIIRESCGTGGMNARIIRDRPQDVLYGVEHYIADPFQMKFAVAAKSQESDNKAVFFDKDINRIEETERTFANLNAGDVLMLEMLFRDKKIKEISKDLFISDSSVKYRLKKLAEKMKFNNSRQMKIILEKTIYAING